MQFTEVKIGKERNISRNMRTLLLLCVVSLLLLEVNGFPPAFPTNPGNHLAIRFLIGLDRYSCIQLCLLECRVTGGCEKCRTVCDTIGMLKVLNEKKVMREKVGVWQRYKTENMEEMLKLLGLGQHYEAAKDFEHTNTIEQTAHGTFRETWEQKETGFKIVTELDHLGDRMTMEQPGFKHQSKLSDIKGGWHEFELDGVKRKHFREYIGNDEYITHAVYTRKSDGKTVDYKEYYKRIQ